MNNMVLAPAVQLVLYPLCVSRSLQNLNKKVMRLLYKSILRTELSLCEIKMSFHIPYEYEFLCIISIASSFLNGKQCNHKLRILTSTTSNNLFVILFVLLPSLLLTVRITVSFLFTWASFGRIFSLAIGTSVVEFSKYFLHFFLDTLHVKLPICNQLTDGESISSLPLCKEHRVLDPLIVTTDRVTLTPYFHIP